MDSVLILTEDGLLNEKKVLALIPTRLNSSRLPQKALLEIKNIPLVVHTFKDQNYQN